ncbi:hypothetical protein DDF62_17025 [Caulobacter radicis]|uniref:Fic family protein n=1 Tax=Caulobacter radicis TaxID=2172650 RepID=UPI000D585AB4|nr:hypothetical protein DDF62_17025 [Caulobacter radicis]
MEAKAAYLVLQGPLTRQSQHLVRQAFVRPAPEPVLTSYWDRIAAKITREEVIELTSCLRGSATSPRTGFVGSGADENGVSVAFPDPDIVPTDLLGEIAINGDDSPFAQACVRLLSVTLWHPFADGNGRLARAMFWAPLITRLGLSTPCVPFAPFLKKQAPAFVGALRHASFSADATNLVGVIASAFQEAVGKLPDLSAASLPRCRS